MPGIEFVEPDPEPGADEELVTGPSRRTWSPRAKRAVRVGAAAVVLVLAGGTLTAVLEHQDHGASPSAAGSTVAGANVLAPEAPSGAFRVDHLGATAPEGARPGTLAGKTPQPSAAPSSDTVVSVDCPVVDACEVSFTPPRAVSAALAARLPGIDRPDCASVLVKGRPPTLRNRRLTARAGRLSVRVDVEPAAVGTRAHSSTATIGNGTTVSATAVVRGFAVTVTVSGPDVEAPGLPTVEALAADPRLLAVA